MNVPHCKAIRLTVACDQSSRVVDIYKEDLAEFTTTIKEDTSKTLETINQKALSKEKGEGSQDESFLGNLVSSLQGGLSSLVTEHPGEEVETHSW